MRLTAYVSTHKRQTLLVVLLATEALLVLGGVLHESLSGVNLVANPSCENVDRDDRPMHWGMYRSHGNGEWGAAPAANTGSNAVYVRPTEFDRRRGDSLNIGLLPASSDGFDETAAFMVEPGRRYRVAFAARGAAPNVRVVLLAWCRSEEEGALERRVLAPREERLTHEWTRYDLTYETPADIVKALPLFHIKALASELPENAVLMLDDVVFSLRPVTLTEWLLGIPDPHSDPEYTVHPVSLAVWLRVLAAAFGLAMIGALLLPTPELSGVERFMLGWACSLFGLGIIGLLAHVLRISGFTLTWFAVLLGLVGIVIRWRRSPRRATTTRPGLTTLLDVLIVGLPGIVLARLAYRAGAGWLLHFGADMGDYLGRARMILADGAFLHPDMGSPYGDYTISAITTTVQSWHAVLARLSGCDLVHVSLVMSVIMAFVVVGALFCLLRALGFQRWLVVAAIPLLFYASPGLTDYRRYAYNRPVAFLVGLLAIACLLRAFRDRRSSAALAWLGALLLGTVATLHIPRTGAVVYAGAVLVVVLTLLANTSGVSSVLPAKRAAVRSAFLLAAAVGLAALFAAPKAESIWNLFVNPLQIAHMPTEKPTSFHVDSPAMVAALLVGGLLMVALGRRRRAERIQFRGALLAGLAIGVAGIAAIHAVYPYAHARNYAEPLAFIWPLLLTVPLLFAVTAALEEWRRPRAYVAIALLLGIVATIPLVRQVNDTASRLARRTDGMAKFNKRRYLGDHTQILRYLDVHERGTWPRIGGDPSQTQTLTTIANIRPASWRLRLPLKTQLFDHGNVPMMESCHLLRITDELEAALWCRRLDLDYVLDDLGEVQRGVLNDCFWRQPDSRSYCVVEATSNHLFRRVPLPPGYRWDEYESRVFRFRVNLADLKADRTPLLLGVRCGDESLPLEDQEHWRRSFIYQFHGKGNHRNWGDLDTTADGLTGRRLFGPYAVIGRTRSLRSAPLRLSFDDEPGTAIKLTLLDDRKCMLYLEMWTGRDWIELASEHLRGDGGVWESVVAVPDVELTRAARFFPQIVPVAAGHAPASIPGVEAADLTHVPLESRARSAQR